MILIKSDCIHYALCDLAAVLTREGDELEGGGLIYQGDVYLRIRNPSRFQTTFGNPPAILAGAIEQVIHGCYGPLDVANPAQLVAKCMALAFAPGALNGEAVFRFPRPFVDKTGLVIPDIDRKADIDFDVTEGELDHLAQPGGELSVGYGSQWARKVAVPILQCRDLTPSEVRAKLDGVKRTPWIQATLDVMGGADG